jgi:glycerophosphoryl diester phosphodiesterase
LDNLDNLSQSTGASVNLGNLVFDGQSSVQDSFDVFNAEWDLDQIFNRNSVTFLNELDNSVRGFDDSDDVINAQGGDDRIFGLSGNDLLRGGAGYDYLDGGRGNDILVGGTEADVFVLARGSGSDTVQDFSHLEGDKFALSGGLTFGRLSILQGTGVNANNALIRAGSTSELLATVVGVQASSLTQSNFLLTA